MAKAKRQPTPGDMVRSMAVILIPILIITFFFTRNLDDIPVTEVDWRPVLATARREAPFPVVAPENLPNGWRATRVTWVKTGEPHLNGRPSARNLWQLGYLTPDDVYIALNQGDLRPAELIDDATREGSPDGSSTVAGRQWERRVSPDDRTRSLVLSTPEVTTVIAGDTTFEGLELYASTLSAA